MLVENLISIIAPIYCQVCSKKDFVLCDNCAESNLDFSPSRCYRCHKITTQSQVCKSCRSSVALSRVWALTPYDGIAKQLIHRLKFQRSSYVAKDIARIMSGHLPILPNNTLITYPPTASSRIRVRGYDQSRVIAKNLAKIKKHELANCFDRISNLRQVGANKAQRVSQPAQTYKLAQNAQIVGRDILIVDDVTTSGATIEYLAKLLKTNGAKSVNAVVFAQAIE